MTDIKLNSFQRMLMNTLSYALVGEQECLSSIGNQQDITVGLMTMKRTIKLGKVRDECVEAI